MYYFDIEKIAILKIKQDKCTAPESKIRIHVVFILFYK